MSCKDRDFLLDNIDLLIRKAVTQLKLKWNLPNSGFIAGGSIANLVWSYVSGNSAKINDIDIFIKSEPKNEKVFEYNKKEVSYSNSYRFLQERLIVKESYKIYNTSREEIFNYIYISKDSNPMMILNSFDINATCVGYCIDDDKTYYNTHFLDFLATGELRISNLITPAHTAIRLAKKRKDLNANLSEKELRIIQVCLNHKNMPDLSRFRFKDRYLNMFNDNISLLSKYFRVTDGEKFLFPKKPSGNPCSEIELESTEIWGICPVESEELTKFSNDIEISIKSIHRKFFTASDLLFYFREIENKELAYIWTKLLPFYNNKIYLDTNDLEKVEYVHNFITKHPITIVGLKGHKLSEQYALIKMVVDTVGKEFDAESAAAVIAYSKLNPKIEIDKFDSVILGLSVRRKVRAFAQDLPF